LIALGCYLTDFIWTEVTSSSTFPSFDTRICTFPMLMHFTTFILELLIQWNLSSIDRMSFQFEWACFLFSWSFNVQQILFLLFWRHIRLVIIFSKGIRNPFCTCWWQLLVFSLHWCRNTYPWTLLRCVTKVYITCAWYWLLFLPEWYFSLFNIILIFDTQQIVIVNLFLFKCGNLILVFLCSYLS